MNILYLHGFGSSGQSNTMEYLKKALPDYYNIEAPDIPVDPTEALPSLRDLCEKEHTPATFLGSWRKTREIWLRRADGG